MQFDSVFSLLIVATVAAGAFAGFLVCAVFL